MPTYPLHYRVTDFLGRQIAWSEGVLAELDAFCRAGDTADVEAHLAQQEVRARESNELAREYAGLASEWSRGAEVPPDAREAIARLSSVSEELLGRVQAGYARAETVVAALRDRNREAQADLRRGRRSVTIYTPPNLEPPGFLDTDA